MDPSLLAILACPKSKKPLRFATKDEIDKMNQKIARHELRNIGGETIEKKITAALVEPEEGILYIIEDDIPRLIYELGIKL
ncbi:MAG: hypothetical protein NZM25_10045 [Leptospiraceae bacterium]|nr:hypothetical protein [Leptospiraceae bacterium]MDW8307490.1 hypothetical protein [Leptospiraceae bacterium]